MVKNEKMENEKIIVFDTTLRDGEQSPGATMTIEEKIIIAKQLEKMGVNVIEAGFPASNKKDFEAITKISEIITEAKVCALARCTKQDIDIAWESVKKAKQPRVHVFIATSDIHLEHKLKINRDEVIKRIKEFVAYAKQKCEDIEFSAEDATRTDKKFLKKVFETAVESGATTINIPDSVGFIQPKEYGDIIKFIASQKKFENVCISVHCHDDMGLAVANSLEAIKAGATQIECTINGIGERAGNAAMEEIVMALKTRSDYYEKQSSVRSSEIINASKMVEQITGIKVQKNKAVVGENAFAHEAGIHQHGVIANPKCYEVIDAKSLCTETKIVIGVHSGKHAVENFMKSKGIKTNETNVSRAIDAIKNAQKGDNIENIIINSRSVRQ
jgi:2-isopropylmalate synthase